MTKPKHWYCETYQMNYYYCIGWTFDEIARYMKKTFQYEFVNKDRVGSCMHCGNIIVIWTKHKKKYDDLAHECLHAANMTLGQCGVKPCFDNDESQTYLTQAIMRKALG